MARPGAFDSDIVRITLFDRDLLVQGWFDEDLLDQQTSEALEVIVVDSLTITERRLVQSVVIGALHVDDLSMKSVRITNEAIEV